MTGSVEQVVHDWRTPIAGLFYQIAPQCSAYSHVAA